MAKVFLKTYGCQMNERDSEQVARMLIERGHELTRREEEADVILLNTCSVRDLAEQKALGKMGSYRKLRARRPEIVLGFLGCMAQSRGADLLDHTPGIDLVVGTQKFHKVADHVDAILRLRQQPDMDDLRRPIVDTGIEPDSQSAIRDHVEQPRQASAFVSIMQGCNMNCSFCIVPATRGRERSRPIPGIVDEIRALAGRGVREVTLLGQIVNLFGRLEFPRVAGKSPFVQLIEAVHEITGIDRIRFTSPHPVGFRLDLVEAIGRLPKVVEHIHLPVQSGSNRILRAMRRGYTAERYLDLSRRLKAAKPGLALTTDLIVGFPGETDADFAATLRLVEEVGFDNAFIFKYSKRRDTAASEMGHQIPDAVKESRNQDLLAIIDRSAKAQSSALVGKRVEILCEGPSKTNPERLSGRTRTNKVVVFEGNQRHIGQIFEVAIGETTGFTLYGDPAIR
jgi:tRNA-2-methylthio-N6-dimethylallyladenosine synthase